MTVAPVSLKLPPFWPQDPQVWFAQVEAQFSTRGISAQQTMFDYVVASLSPEIALEVRDLILTPPTDDPYKVLKEQLVNRTAASEQRRLQQLFNAEELGDRKPSQLLRRMNQLLGDKASTTDSTFLQELFLQRLPANVRMVLASTAEPASLEQLATLADKIMEAVASPSISNVETSQLSTELSELRAEVARLRQLVDSHRRPSRTRSSRTRSSSPALHRTQPQPVVCWYHKKFGEAARKCKPPCSKSENTQASR